MAFLSMTYTFANSTTADAGQVNTNFQDVINATSDGTKDFNINALTCAGAAVLNGNITLGNASTDDLTIGASLAGTVLIKTNASFNFGDATHGFAGLYLGNSTFTTKLATAATASYTFTLPVTGGSSGQVLKTDGSGGTSWSSGANSYIQLDTGLAGAHGGSSSGDTKIRNFANSTVVGSDLSYTARTTTTADKITVLVAGVYSISYTDIKNTGGFDFGITLNTTQTSTNIGSLTNASEILAFGGQVGAGSGVTGHVSVTRRLAINDIIRAHTDAGPDNTTKYVRLVVTKVDIG
jgi:hypothetical protein